MRGRDRVAAKIRPVNGNYRPTDCWLCDQKVHAAVGRVYYFSIQFMTMTPQMWKLFSLRKSFSFFSSLFVVVVKLRILEYIVIVVEFLRELSLTTFQEEQNTVFFFFKQRWFQY